MPMSDDLKDRFIVCYHKEYSTDRTCPMKVLVTPVLGRSEHPCLGHTVSDKLIEWGQLTDDAECIYCAG
jgi:hypothetical protein